MMHLTAATPSPRFRWGRMKLTGCCTAAPCRCRCHTQYRVVRPARLVFRSARANLLEFAAAAFHYSVIGPVGAARRAAGFSLNAYRLSVVCGAVARTAVAQGNDGWRFKPGHASSGSEPAAGTFDAKDFGNGSLMIAKARYLKVS